MSAEKKNILLFIITTAMRTVALIVSTEAILQTFLYSVGFGQSEIYVQSIVYQAFSTGVILLMSSYADRGSIQKRSFLALALGGAAVLVYLPLTAAKGISLSELALLLIAAALHAAGIALHTVCTYKLPYYIFSPTVYGPTNAVCGVIGSGISFAVGSVMTLLSGYFAYADIMRVVLPIAAAVFALSGLLHLFMKPVSGAISGAEEQQTPRISVKELVTQPCLYTLLPGHFFRGFATGTTTVLAVVASGYLGYGEQITTVQVSVYSIAAVVGCVVYGLTARIISARLTIAIGSISFLALPLILIPDTPLLYLAVFALVIFGRTLVDYAVPTKLLYVVPSRLAGPYNAWRMAIHSLGILTATSVAIVIPAPIFILITVLAQLISGANFFLAKVMRRKDTLLREGEDQ